MWVIWPNQGLKRNQCQLDELERAPKKHNVNSSAERTKFPACVFTLGDDDIRVLAIDQAKTTGYAVFDDDELVDYGIIELGKKTDKYESILYSARKKIGRLMDKTNADRVVIEDIQQQNQNVSTYKKLAMLMGVLLSLFQENNVLHDVVPPTRWKSYCGIKSRKRIEQKKETILFVEEKYALQNVQEDEADAISLGFFAISNIKTDANLNKS